jgi:serine phosphatase RsbU (regulator of sigma subunit)
MAAVTLTISGHGKTWQIEPNAEGTIIGRGSLCDIVLESRDISREHARIFQDPFGRWIAEDLGSSNGIFINGKRVEACAVLPGEPIVIGSFSLKITQSLDQQIKRDDSVQTTATVTTDGFETGIISGESKLDEALSHPCLKELDEIIERLSKLTSLSALYPEVCRCLAREREEVAAVLRLPEKAKPMPKSPEIIACHFGGKPDDTTGQDTANYSSSRLALRLSRHLLESVQTTGNAAMVRTIYSSDAEITSTSIDEHSPRAIICAPLGDVTKVFDLLYLDIPVDKATPDMLKFVWAVSRQVILTRKSLTLMQVKAERSILDNQLSLAQKIQSRLAPTIPQDLSGVELSLYYKPVMWVGGDYCDVWLLNDGRLAFAIGDVSCEGLAAAMVMSNLQTALRTAMSFCSKPSEVMKHVNLHLIQNLPEGMSVTGVPFFNKSQNGNPTLFLGLFDQAKGTLEYVNAGHLQPLIVRPQSTVMPLGQPGNSVLGVGDASFRTNVETIQQGARLLVFTDGITEAKSPDGKEFGVKRITYLLKTADDSSAEHIINLVTGAVEDFRKLCPQQDDITVFALFNRG